MQMNTKTLRSLAIALLVSSLPLPAIAESLGEHPAVLVARAWNSRDVDPNTLGLIPNTFVFLHPAGPLWIDGSSTAGEDEATQHAPSRMVSAKNVSSR
jgi:hypothetical protein